MTQAFRSSSSRTSALVDAVVQEGLALSDELFALQEVHSASSASVFASILTHLLKVLHNGISPPRKRRRLKDGAAEVRNRDLSHEVVADTNMLSDREAL